MIAIDTNVLLRFLFKPVDSNNPKWQVDTAEALINKAGKVFISSIVIAETEWVLESVFECNRQERRITLAIAPQKVIPLLPAKAFGL